jgi:hypothetical protein
MINEMKNGVFTYNDESYDFVFSTSLSAYDKLVFVKTVVDSLVDNNGYYSVIRDLIFDFVIIQTFTNVDTSFINNEDDNGNKISQIIIIEHFLEKSNIVDIVKANMDVGLLDELNRSIDLNIQYLTGIHTNPLGDAVSNLVSTLEKKINDVDLNGMMGMAQKFIGMTEDFTLENIVNAYMNGDIHKKNLAEIEEAKESVNVE